VNSGVILFQVNNCLKTKKSLCATASVNQTCL